LRLPPRKAKTWALDSRPAFLSDPFKFASGIINDIVDTLVRASSRSSRDPLSH
jgi:hypothetical protein